MTATYVYSDPSLRTTARFHHDGLDRLSERHQVELDIPVLTHTSLERAAAASDISGVVIRLHRGWPSRQQLMAARRALRSGKRALFHWPEERAVEVVDRERLRSYLLLYAVASLYRLASRRQPPPPPPIEGDEVGLPVQEGPSVLDEVEARCEHVLTDPRPAALEPRPVDGSVQGTGVYLRTDFWAPITTGGSYGHTCYVANELAGTTEDFVCLLANRFSLLDDLGVRQVELERPGSDSNEEALLAANAWYLRQLRPVLEVLRPSYLYERLCLGNMVAATLSRELGIPYIVEYNGSEISMQRSFGEGGFEHAELFERIELAAFAQATAISVISKAVGDSLMLRGVDPGKVLVNPNGADPNAYRPTSGSERVQLRADLGFDEAHRVVGFIGTFGGWHGIEVLAEVIPLVCQNDPEVRFLLVGDGPHRSLVEDKVRMHRLQERVVMPGRVSHEEGARLLSACDVFVSPHSSHMSDSRFFGSPTKLFEYMAMGGGIVASDLEQIGEVLSPSFRPSDFASGAPEVADERAVLCTPGDVWDLVEGIRALVRHPEVSDELGQNARRAVVEEFSWERHVQRLWRFLAEQPDPSAERSRLALPPLRNKDSDEAMGPALLPTGDAYKEEAQRLWNRDPCGSQYMQDTSEHTLEWFLAAERYRYEEYAPWMPETMEFERWTGRDVLEIGAGLGTDLAQFAANGAIVTDFDLADGHLQLAKENFALRGLVGEFVHGDAEKLPFEDDRFDLVYSNGVLHHIPDTEHVISEIHRVLKPGGKVIVMVYAEPSLHYWRNLVGAIGLYRGELWHRSIGEILSRSVEVSTGGARPLVKVYSKQRLRRMFSAFGHVEIVQRQMVPAEKPALLRWVPLDLVGRTMGWNLVVKGHKRPAPPGAGSS